MMLKTKLTPDLNSLAGRYGDLALHAMLTEVNLSPKPGLVDRLNCGAHQDMTLGDFYRSARAIAPWFSHFITLGARTAALREADILAQLRPVGLACEADMFRATAGVNTHKGTIFSLGLLCTAVGRLHQQKQRITPDALGATVAAFCRGITARELQQSTGPLTAGQRLYRLLGLRGARGEAEAGYPLVCQLALPHYRSLLAAGTEPEFALLDTLMLLMAHNGDTNIASRGGLDGLLWLQQQAKRVMGEGGIRRAGDLQKLHDLDRQCIARNLSPGGSADLLIVTWFLNEISRSTCLTKQ